MFCRSGSFQVLLPFVTRHFLFVYSRELISWHCRKSLQPLFMRDEISRTGTSLWPSVYLFICLFISPVVVVFQLLSLGINLYSISCRFSATGLYLYVCNCKCSTFALVSEWACGALQNTRFHLQAHIRSHVLLVSLRIFQAIACCRNARLPIMPIITYPIPNIHFIPVHLSWFLTSFLWCFQLQHVQIHLYSPGEFDMKVVFRRTEDKKEITGSLDLQQKKKKSLFYYTSKAKQNQIYKSSSSSFSANLRTSQKCLTSLLCTIHWLTLFLCLNVG